MVHPSNVMTVLFKESWLDRGNDVCFLYLYPMPCREHGINGCIVSMHSNRLIHITQLGSFPCIHVDVQGAEVVECACMIELKALNGVGKLHEHHPDVPVWSLISEDVLTVEGKEGD